MLDRHGSAARTAIEWGTCIAHLHNDLNDADEEQR